MRVLLVHGWGMNQCVWQPLQQALCDDIELIAIDLPGHGERHQQSFHDLQSLTDDLQQTCELLKQDGRPLLLVGWSLGGLPCMQLAMQQPALVDGLLLVSSNPCFVSRADWASGVQANVFEQFAESLQEDFSGTIRRFLSLQVKGSESGRKTLRSLREKILQQAQPNQQSLNAGLDVLKCSDLREQLSQIRQPVSWALGAQDGLVPATLQQGLKKLLPEAQVALYEKAGHASFLSHTDEFVQQLKRCVETLEKT